MIEGDSPSHNIREALIMSRRLKIHKGERYGRYTIIHEVEQRNKKRYFLCKCDCGNEREVRLVALRAGEIKSCGCLRDEQNRVANLRHGGWGTRLYNIWHGMKQRCLNPNDSNYIHYGGRGIGVCVEWLEFELFQEWALSNGYRDDLTIERTNVDGDYEPSNCSWISQSEQLMNTRRSRWITYNGRTKNLKEWSEKLNIDYKTLQRRLSSGWTFERAINEPIGGYDD